MFNSKKELALALLEGRRFTVPSGAIIFYDGTVSGSPFRYKKHSNEEPLRGAWNSYALVEEIQLENNPLCVHKGEPIFVRDSETDAWQVDILLQYRKGLSYPWICERSSWALASRITYKEDL